LTLPSKFDEDFGLEVVDPSQLLDEVPFKKDIRLAQTYIAGTMFVEDIEDKLGSVTYGTDLELRRDPSNPYDRNAIEVLNCDGNRIGFLPRKINPIAAGLMDSGKHLYCRVTCMVFDMDYTGVDVDIMMEDL
jgi:hypothetical protein